MIFPYLTVHLVIIHAPDALAVLLQITVNRAPSLADDVPDKAHVIRPMQKNPVARLCQYIDRARDKAMHSVFISDILSGKTRHMIPLLLPSDNGIVIFVLRHKIAEQRMLCPSDQCVRNGRTGFEIHIRHPHRDKIKTLRRRTGFKSPDTLSGSIYRCGVHSPSVNH